MKKKKKNKYIQCFFSPTTGWKFCPVCGKPLYIVRDNLVCKEIHKNE